MSKKDGFITEEGIAEIRKRIGVEVATREPSNEYATEDAIRHFAWGMGDTNPLFNDATHAKSTRYGSMVAPCTFLYSTRGSFPEGLPGVQSMFSGMEFENLLPIRAGDKIAASVYISNLEEKESKFATRTLLEEWVWVFRNQRNETLSKLKTWMIRTERHQAREKGKYKSIEPQKYSDEELAAIEADYDKEEIRGATPRYWEDVEVGQQLAPVVKGPLTVTDMIGWKIGWGWRPFIRPHRIGLEFRRRHPGFAIKNAQGIPDVPERAHWDSEYAQQAGVPAAYDYGPQRIAWLGQIMTNWIGDDGFLKKFRGELRRFNILGDTTWLEGKVTRKYVDGDEYLVDCEIWGKNQRGEVTAPGLAVASLPSREHNIWPTSRF